MWSVDQTNKLGKRPTSPNLCRVVLPSRHVRHAARVQFRSPSVAASARSLFERAGIDWLPTTHVSTDRVLDETERALETASALWMAKGG
jgi:hypothetical protein